MVWWRILLKVHDTYRQRVGLGGEVFNVKEEGGVIIDYVLFTVHKMYVR